MDYSIEDLPALDKSHNTSKFKNTSKEVELPKNLPDKYAPPSAEADEVKMSEFKGPPPPESEDTYKSFLFTETFATTYDISDLPDLDDSPTSHGKIRTKNSVSTPINSQFVSFSKPAYSTPEPKATERDSRNDSLQKGGVTIQISGFAGENCDKICGTFRERDVRHNLGMRASYLGQRMKSHSGLSIILWYWQDKGTWMIGREEHVGTEFAYACVKSKAETPLGVNADWYIFNPKTNKHEKNKLIITQSIEKSQD